MLQILLATYNGEKFLREQLDSLLNQTYDDFEIIARDDCSEDATFEILSEYKKKFPKKFTIYQNDKPTGSAKDNFFLLMNDADSDYIMFCDQDDYWLPEKIELTLKKMKCIEEEGVPCLIHTDLSVTDDKLNITHKSFFKMQHLDNCVDNTPLNRAIVQNAITGCTVMINKALLDLVKNKNNEKIIMHDWWLGITASAFGKIYCIKSPTILYRQHKNNEVGAKRLQYRKKDDLKNSLLKTYTQTEYFYKFFKKQLSKEQAILLSKYMDLKKYPKIKKIRTIIKYRFFKHSLLRKIVQLYIS